MHRIKLLGLAVLTLSLIVMSFTQGFGQESAVAEAIPEAVATDEKPAPATTIRPLTVAAGLIDDTVITGTLLDSTSLAIKTAFGEASIPLSEVAGIRFPAAEDSSTTIVMLNGDSITGATDLKFVNVETSWGSAKINGQNVATMLFVPGLAWKPVQALGGKRWSLTEATPAARPQNNVQPAGGLRPSNAIPQRQPQVIYPR